MTDYRSDSSLFSDGEPSPGSAKVRVCKRPGCEAMFEPRAHNQRYCSLRCKRWVSNHSARHLAAKARHDARRRESGLKAMQDARWYANGGWEKQDRAQRRRRLAEKIERLEQLTGQDRPDLTEALDGAGLVWTLKRPESAHSDETRDALGRLWV